MEISLKISIYPKFLKFPALIAIKSKNFSGKLFFWYREKLKFLGKIYTYISHSPKKVIHSLSDSFKKKLDLTSIMLSHVWFCMVSLRLNFLRIQWVFALTLVMSFKKKLSLTLFMLFKACCNLSGYSEYPWEALLKISSRSNIRKLIKTLHDL